MEIRYGEKPKALTPAPYNLPSIAERISEFFGTFRAAGFEAILLESCENSDSVSTRRAFEKHVGNARLRV
jgi:hypothetical protein